MAVAGVIMVTYSVLMEGMFQTLAHSIVRMELGSAQIHAPGYREAPDLYLRIPRSEQVVAGLGERGYPAAPRWYGYALVARDKQSAGAELRGIDVAREAKVTELHRHVAKGTWLDPDDPHGVVLGRKLARMLDASVGDELVLLSQAADGSMANALYRVRGVLKAVSARSDQAGIFLTAAALRELLVLDARAHEIAVFDPRQNLDALMAAARAEAPGQNSESWRALQPVMAELLDQSQNYRFIMFGITYGAVAMVVLNATLMSVFERMREFAVMKAVGLAPSVIARAIAWEVGWQSGIAALLAAGSAWPLVRFLSTEGLDLRRFASTMTVSGIAWEPVWRAAFTPSAFWSPLAALVLMSFFAALYPGYRAATTPVLVTLEAA